jgi:hypothetical protein
MRSRLNYLEREARLAQIDREWELERENYLITGRSGGRQVPTVAGSAIGAIFLVGFGIVWTIFAFAFPGGTSAGGAMPFPVLGALLILVGVGWSIFVYTKAQGYQRAHAEYRRRRQAAERDDAE